MLGQQKLQFSYELPARCLFPGRANALLRVTKCINTPLLPFSREGTRMVNGPARSRKA